MGERLKGKRLIGAQASPELWEAVDRWLVQHPGQSVTDFLIDACLEKLEGEHIPVDRAAVLRDGRMRVPLPEAKPVRYETKRGARVSSKPPGAEVLKAISHAGAAQQLAQESAPKQTAGGPSADKPAPVAGAGKAKR